jgi:hypothetical protein
VLCKQTVFEANDIGGNSGSGPPVSAGATVRNDVIALDEELVFMPQRVWR